MGRPALLLLLLLVASLATCSRGPRASGGAEGPLALRPMPDDPDERREAMVAFGESVLGALRETRLQALVLDDDALDAFLDAQGALRARASRAVGGPAQAPAEELAPFRDTTFAGICLQGARNEGRDDALGLRRRAWVFDRALVAARRSDGRRVASWVEGSFVFTTRGFFAIGLRRVEAPRWEHSDLELAPCDMEAVLR